MANINKEDYNEEDKSYCNKIIVFPQYGPTCWFNAILMSVLYSQRSRNMLLNNYINTWNTSIDFFRVLKHILKHKFIQSDNANKDYNMFEKIRPENIIKMMRDYNPKYILQTAENHGGLSEVLIPKFYKLLGVKCLMFKLFNNNIFYDDLNHVYQEYDINKKKIILKVKFMPLYYIINKLKFEIKNPDVIIINLYEDKYNTGDLPFYYKIKNDDILNLKDNIIYNNEEYILDSVILYNDNFGNTKSNHAICGITCNNDRYVYNGWTIRTNDPGLQNKSGYKQIPCKLQRFKWDIHVDNLFCLGYNCGLHKPDKNKTLCFSFAKSHRTLIYIKKSKSEELKNQDYNNPSVYQSYIPVSNGGTKILNNYIYFNHNGKQIKKKIFIIDGKKKLKVNKNKYVSIQTFRKKYLV